MKKNTWLLLLIAIVLVGGGYFWYRKTQQPNSRIKYITAVVQKGTITSSVSGSGTVIVKQSVNIDPTITGTVTNLNVNIGERVKKGQTLFTIFNDQLGVNAAQAQSSYDSAISALDSARSNEASLEADLIKLLNINSSSSVDIVLKQIKIDSAKTAIVSAEQSVNSALTTLNYQKQQAADRTVTSPIDGTVNAVNIQDGDDLGKLTSGNSRVIPIIIGDLNTMKAQVLINEIDAPHVQPGQTASSTLSAIPNVSISGKVEKIDSLGTVAEGVVTYNATISFDKLNPLIKPGMSVDTSIITGVKKDIIIVPNAAIKTVGNSSIVEILNNGQKTPKQTSVKTGLTSDTVTEVNSGLKVGDKVVTRTINPNTTPSNAGPTRLPGLGGGGGSRF